MTQNKKNIKAIFDLDDAVKAAPARTAWSKGVKAYAEDLIDDLCFNVCFSAEPVNTDTLLNDWAELEKALLNGADDWYMFSEGGYALIYNRDIAERLCTPSELEKTRHGEREPNSCENWIDTQSRALWQASRLIKKCAGL